MLALNYILSFVYMKTYLSIYIHIFPISTLWINDMDNYE